MPVVGIFCNYRPTREIRRIEYRITMIFDNREISVHFQNEFGSFSKNRQLRSEGSLVTARTTTKTLKRGRLENAFR